MHRVQRSSVTLEEEARKLDNQLRKKTRSFKKLTIEIGAILNEIRQKELHKYISRPGSRKRYIHFDEYASEATGMSESSVWMTLKIFGLTEGPNSVASHDIEEMPFVNAYELAKIPPENRTPALVREAKDTSHRNFRIRVHEIRKESLPSGWQMPLRVEFFRKLHFETARILEDTIQDFCLLPAVRDGNRDKTLQEKAIEALCSAALAFAGPEISAAREEDDKDRPEVSEPDNVTGEKYRTVPGFSSPDEWRINRRVNQSAGSEYDKNGIGCADPSRKPDILEGVYGSTKVTRSAQDAK